MFVVINTIGVEDVAVGDPVVIKYDAEFGRIGAFGIDGKAYGYFADCQPHGCVDGWTMYSRIEDRRIIARAAYVCNGSLYLEFYNAAFAVGSYGKAEFFCKYSQMLA